MTDEQPEAVTTDVTVTHDVNERTARKELTIVLTKYTDEPQGGLELLERVERALWACAIAASKSAGLAREGFEVGIQAFLRDN